MLWAPAIPASSPVILLVMRPLTSLASSAALLRKVELAFSFHFTFFSSRGGLHILLKLSDL